MEDKKYWMSPVPLYCQSCNANLGTSFYDAATQPAGIWGIICPTCFHFGPGPNKLGPGIAQQYEKQQDGRWLKVGG